jgi:hypothetical protein
MARKLLTAHRWRFFGILHPSAGKMFVRVRHIRRVDELPIVSWVSLTPLLDAAHWTAVVFAGMLAVVFLAWALELTAPQSGRAETNGTNDASGGQPDLLGGS